MADNSKAIAQVVGKPEVDKSNYEWVEVPATDIFGAPFSGVSINFEQYKPEEDENGRVTGKVGKYFLDPERAGEVKRLLKLRQVADMRILQPNQDQKLFEILRRGGKPIPNQTNF
jgi:hypothetical protein